MWADPWGAAWALACGPQGTSQGRVCWGQLSRRTGAFLSVIQTHSLCFKERERWRRDAPQTRWFSFSGFEG